MTRIWHDEYEGDLEEAVRRFWLTRDAQARRSMEGVPDTGTRGAVTGGQQMEGFVDLFKKIAVNAGVPEKCIFETGNYIPGYFRPTKDWDLLIISPGRHLIASLEFKSQVGSFGNNFNNRAEEALGCAVDINTAFREGAFGAHEAPWLGYLVLVERSMRSSRPVKIMEPHFRALEEFHNTSYLDRYGILCNRLILERHYNSACALWTSNVNGAVTSGSVPECVKFKEFVKSYAGFLLGKSSEFEA